MPPLPKKNPTSSVDNPFTPPVNLSEHQFSEGGLHGGIIDKGALPSDPSPTPADGCVWVWQNTGSGQYKCKLGNGTVHVLAPGAIRTVRKSATETVNNSSALQDDDELKFDVAANETWMFMFNLWVSGDETADIKFGFTQPAGCTVTYLIKSLAAAATTGTGGVNYDVLAGPAGGASTTIGVDNAQSVVEIWGLARNGANAGTVQLQWAQSTPVVADTKVYLDSWLMAVKEGLNPAGGTGGGGGLSAHDHTSGDGSGVLTNDEHDGYSELAEITIPANPAANKLRVYAKDVGGVTKLHTLDSAGTETAMGSGGGHTIRENGTDQTTLAGLDFIDANAGVGLLTDGATANLVHLDLYVLLGVGRAGGSTIYGGSGASENLALGSTSHATKGLITTDSSLQIGTGMSILDGSGNIRISLSAANPFIDLKGSAGGVRIEGALGLRNSIPGTGAGVALDATYSTAPGGGNILAAKINPSISFSDTVTATLVAVGGVADLFPKGGSTITYQRGLDYLARLGMTTAQMASGDVVAITEQTGAHLQLGYVAVLIGSGTRTHNISKAQGLFIEGPALSISGAGTTTFNVTTYLGIEVAAVAISNAEVVVTNAFGIRVGDITGTSFTAANNRIVQFGTATPTTTSGLFEMMANFTAAANQTPIYISEGATPTRRQLQTKAGNTLGAGDLVCVLV